MVLLLVSKLSPESAHGARVNGLVDPYHAYATHPHRPTVLAANLEMLPLPVADHTLSSQFFLCLDRPAWNDREVAAVIDGVAPVLVQLQKYVWRRGPRYRNGRKRRRRGPGRLRWRRGPGRLQRRSREGSHHGWINVRDKIPEQIPGPNKGGLLGWNESTGPRIRQRVTGTGSSSANRIRPSSTTSDSSGGRWGRWRSPPEWGPRLRSGLEGRIRRGKGPRWSYWLIVRTGHWQSELVILAGHKVRPVAAEPVRRKWRRGGRYPFRRRIRRRIGLRRIWTGWRLNHGCLSHRWLSHRWLAHRNRNNGLSGASNVRWRRSGWGHNSCRSSGIRHPPLDVLRQLAHHDGVGSKELSIRGVLGIRLILEKV